MTVETSWKLDTDEDLARLLVEAHDKRCIAIKNRNRREQEFQENRIHNYSVRCHPPGYIVVIDEREL
jgi:hypothetical protein